MPWVSLRPGDGKPCVAEGNRNREIAERLFISEEPVKIHIKHVMGETRRDTLHARFWCR